MSPVLVTGAPVQQICHRLYVTLGDRNSSAEPPSREVIAVPFQTSPAFSPRFFSLSLFPPVARPCLSESSAGGLALALREFLKGRKKAGFFFSKRSALGKGFPLPTCGVQISGFSVKSLMGIYRFRGHRTVLCSVFYIGSRGEWWTPKTQLCGRIWAKYPKFIF